jgi:type IV pilus assembly protein PilO
VKRVTIKKNSAAVRLAAVIGGLLVLAAAGYFILVKPLKSKASALTAEIAETSTEIKDRNAEAQQSTDLSKILVADYFRLKTAMPDESQVPEMILQLEAIAGDTGVSFDGVEPGAVINATDYQVIPLSLTFEGSFIDLSNFLYRLRSLVQVQNHELVARGRLFTIDKVSFAQGAAGFPSISATVMVNAYVYGHPNTVASTGAPSSTETSTTSTEGTSTSTTSTETTPTASATASGAGGASN